MRWLAFLMVAGCIDSNAVDCGDGRVCPHGTVCATLADYSEAVCASPDQIAQCSGKSEFDTCTLDGASMAQCYDGVCLPGGCGNGIMDPGELCDDGNTNNDDGCSSDCKSNEMCGNGVVDAVHGELCDDGNASAHDGCYQCAPEQMRWVQHLVTLTPTREHPGLAYDPIIDRIVMYGGDTYAPISTNLNDSWEWNGADWTRFLGVTPAPLASPAMAFDGARLVVTASQSDTPGTWGFDGKAWSELAAGIGGNRFSTPIAYDSRRTKVVAIDGTTDMSVASITTREWDGTSWKVITTAHSPPNRGDATAGYDPVRGEVVLAGGFHFIDTGMGFTITTWTDTWTYDGTDWKDVTPGAGPVPPTSATMAFDTGSQRLIATTGCYGTMGCVDTAKTLAWDGAQWIDLGLDASSPPARVYSSMASSGSRLVLFGGEPQGSTTTFGDTWVFEAGAWKQAALPGGRKQFAIANDSTHQQIVVFGGADPTGNPLDETWLRGAHGWTKYTGAGPTARTGAVMAADPNAGDVVLFGGSGGETDTWVWDGSSWASRSPAQVPPSPGPLAFDGAHLTMVTSGETWSWTGANWTKATPATPLPARSNACTAYDPLRKQLVLFGGYDGINNLDETWTYDGTDWKKHAVAFHPGARSGCALAWNAARGRLVMIGSGSFDVWEWDGAQWSVIGSTDDPPALGAFGAATSLDGNGVFIYGSTLDQVLGNPIEDQLWELRWHGPGEVD